MDWKQDQHGSWLSASSLVQKLVAASETLQRASSCLNHALHACTACMTVGRACA